MRRSYDTLTKAFTTIAIEAGVKPKGAKARATRAVVLIEGALIVSRVTGDRSAFRAAIDEENPDDTVTTE